ncbi:AraC family transcriptional regulator [Leifsonia soli]
MVQTGLVSSITQMRYRAPDPHGRLVETFTFARLRSMNDGGTQRADFHVLAFIDAGMGSLTVDFAEHALFAGAVVWIAPGAVHRWDDVAQLAGRLVLFVPTAPVTDATRALVANPRLQPVSKVRDDERRFVDAALDHLVLETGDPAGASAELPAILLSALLARLRPHEAAPEGENRLFLAFRECVETDFREHHDAEHYARVLGYAPRTLSRAVKRATGATAKAYLAERITLEAKRLLAHDGLTSAACAAALGFTDASNFSVFFRQATGERPGAWQRAAVGTVPEPPGRPG